MTSLPFIREHLAYRLCVGIALFNKQGQVFVGERIDSPGAWQMPQGGIDEGEAIEVAALRELHEETGITNVQIIRIAPENIRYDLPDETVSRLWNGRFRGQEQTWVALRYDGDDGEINLNAHHPPEFLQWQWIDLPQTLDLIVPFKRETYKKVISLFADLPDTFKG